MNLILQIILSSVAVYFTAWLLPGISVKSFWTSVIVAIVLGLLNAVVKPIMEFFSFPITIITFGLFLFVINALIILIASWLIDDFQVQSFWWALLFSIIVSIVNGFLGKLIS